MLFSNYITPEHVFVNVLVQLEMGYSGLFAGMMTIVFDIGLSTGGYEILVFESLTSLGVGGKISLLSPVSDNLKARYG